MLKKAGQSSYFETAGVTNDQQIGIYQRQRDNILVIGLERPESFQNLDRTLRILVQLMVQRQ